MDCHGVMGMPCLLLSQSVPSPQAFPLSLGQAEDTPSGPQSVDPKTLLHGDRGPRHTGS